MNVLRVMLKYVGYYILIMLLVSAFAGSATREVLMIVCGAALSISMFSAIIQLIVSGDTGMIAQKVSAWCLRGTVITVSIVIITRIGIGNIVRLFTGS